MYLKIQLHKQLGKGGNFEVKVPNNVKFSKDKNYIDR